jgi:kumamolisin
MAQSGKVNLQGSERSVMPGARQIGPADPNEIIDVTVIVGRRSRAAKTFPSIATLGATPLTQRRHLTREEFASTHGAAPEDCARIRAFAVANGLTVKSESAGRRTVMLSGTVAAFSAAFSVDLQRYDHPSGQFRGRTGAIQIPAELATIIDGVFGLDNRAQAAPHFRILREGPHSGKKRASAVSYTPLQVAQAYDYPANLDGSGQCIGILELGGGYNASDLSTYFGNLGIKTPQVIAVSVDGATNTPAGDPNSADGEVALDIEVVGAIAPAAKIAVYFAPNTDQGFLDALTTAIHDTTNKPSVISISWGGPESSWTSQAMNAMDAAAQDAATLGVTICVASGDNGATDGATDGQNHVDFPASSPSVLGCGGTDLQITSGKITSETVWNDGASGGATGGGVSEQFALPTWQQSAKVPKAPNNFVGRGVPDVAGDADPNSGYQIFVDGESVVVGGTSAVAPLWSALIALISQKLTTAAGYLNPLVYAAPAEPTFHDITKGNNNGYSAGSGWDPCSGVGTPNGAALLSALTQDQPTKSKVAR